MDLVKISVPGMFLQWEVPMRGTQNNEEYIYCSWLHILTRCQDSVAEDTPHSTCRAKKNYSWTEHETTFLLSGFPVLQSAMWALWWEKLLMFLYNIVSLTLQHSLNRQDMPTFTLMTRWYFLDWIWGLPYRREFMPDSVNMVKTPLLEKSKALAEEQLLFIVSVVSCPYVSGWSCAYVQH